MFELWWQQATHLRWRLSLSDNSQVCHQQTVWEEPPQPVEQTHEHTHTCIYTHVHIHVYMSVKETTCTHMYMYIRTPHQYIRLREPQLHATSQCHTSTDSGERRTSLQEGDIHIFYMYNVYVYILYMYNTCRWSGISSYAKCTKCTCTCTYTQLSHVHVHELSHAQHTTNYRKRKIHVAGWSVNTQLININVVQCTLL